ncbi:MAG: ATP-binding cassette domain-containing protein [Lentisphaeria bacterium]|jgi:iron complex transport system ATP-binding protein
MAGRERVVTMAGVRLWRGDTVILDGVDWAVERGRHWALVGPNGCGKTTLLKVLCGWLFPSEGRVAVLGREFGSCVMAELRREIGWVTTSLVGMIPEGMVTLGVVLGGGRNAFVLREEPTEGELEAARDHLAAVGCLERWELPYHQLSQGEQMRVLIARALMGEPRLLILDEPCTALDPVARDAFLGNVGELLARRPELTLVYVTHHLEEILPAVTEVLALRRGRVVASGGKEAVLTPATLERVFGRPFVVRREGGRFFAQPQVAPGSAWHLG